MALTDSHVENVCGFKSTNLLSKTCRYIETSTNSAGKLVFVCAKLSHNKKSIDKSVDNYLNSIPIGSSHHVVGTSDNCSGYLPLTEIKQGYDVD